MGPLVRDLVHDGPGLRREWTGDGEVHETRRPKGGPRNAIRRVPIPPVLVQMIREHVGQFGTAPEGRLSRTLFGMLWPVGQSLYPVDGMHTPDQRE